MEKPMNWKPREGHLPLFPTPNIYYSKSEEDFMRGDPWLNLDLPTRIGPVFSPSFDLLETGKAYRLLGDIPGLELENLDLEWTAHSLTITGERDAESLAGGLLCHALERTFGTFSRTFAFLEPVAGESHRARMINGVLVIEVPKQFGHVVLDAFGAQGPGGSQAGH